MHIRKGVKNIPLPEDHAIFVFQSVRELLFNILKHADTNQATVSLNNTASHELQVMIEDAGRGFHLSNESYDYARPGKFGLFSILERVEALRGEDSD